MNTNKFLTSDRPRTYEVQYSGSDIHLKTMTEVKICGIWYCNDHERAYNFGIEKIVTVVCHMAVAGKGPFINDVTQVGGRRVSDFVTLCMKV